jgi:hypothetical protein
VARKIKGVLMMINGLKVTEDNKLNISDYDCFSSDAVRLINSFNELHVIDRSLHLYDLICSLKERKEA